MITYRRLGADDEPEAWRPVPRLSGANGPRRDPADRRPVVALDVDGVLNALSPEGRRPQGWLGFEVRIPAACQEHSSFRRGHGREDLQLLLTLDPEHVGWIHRLQRRAEVVWATTWTHLANDVIGPLLGLSGPLPVLDLENCPFSYLKSADSIAAKTWVLREFADERPAVLVDDRPWPSWTQGRELDGRGFAVATDPSTGWDAAGLAAVEMFLDWADTAAPEDRFGFPDGDEVRSVTVSTATGHRLDVLSHPQQCDRPDELRWRAPDGSVAVFDDFWVRGCRVGLPVDVMAIPEQRGEEESPEVAVGSGVVTRIVVDADLDGA